ncbi:3-methyl-2-oxobutanoate hydroxymethyltransferase [Helicobacter sp. 13S00401-1]|uniref:3-methyl-2-oxobutanoate hydroxymethyltransferase n=1 Tax=Helicobacter sp. 13S00401-1 TaxID=1905758 RepID=UPI000BA6C22C|nr:3-methyl-2-oxobutanoate hydroxymethyltransferase [Helicobacter sp. 13S00401-1]PAF49350.1 3-methyl-2-oxobutanoate hydroxymethyltransferase [Helicobacter sp. 13S00401-1]
MGTKITAKALQAKKNVEQIVCITAYDALFANIFDKHVDLILIGDSLNMSFNNESDTLTIGMDEMIYHSRAVCRGASQAYIVADMPFGSYGSVKQAVKNATRFYKETKVDAIKLEGGSEVAPIIKAIVDRGISVVGHIGLMPQMARSEGGFHVQGKDEKSLQKIFDDALDVQKAGAMALVLEGTVANLAKDLQRELKIPVIGIGAGNECDGQILVWSDAFGFFTNFKPKFVRRFLNGAELVEDALKNYVKSVKTKEFPDSKETYL